MPLFEVAILEKPTKKEIEDGTGKEKLLFGPKSIVARDATAALVGAMMGSNGEPPLKVDLDRVEVLIRPFATPLN